MVVVERFDGDEHLGMDKMNLLVAWILNVVVGPVVWTWSAGWWRRGRLEQALRSGRARNSPGNMGTVKIVTEEYAEEYEEEYQEKYEEGKLEKLEMSRCYCCVLD